jgi:hypothetical protein
VYLFVFLDSPEPLLGGFIVTESAEGFQGNMGHCLEWLMNQRSAHQKPCLRILALSLSAALALNGGAMSGQTVGRGPAAGVQPAGRQSKAPLVNAMSAARFLEQSSWGPTAASIAQVQSAGLQAYLQQQLGAPISTYVTPGPGDDLTFVQKQFFVNAIQGQDQLRQRMSFALSEIMVISANKAKIIDPTEFSLWMNMLQNDAFGNFFTLLKDVTLSPAMGYYLDMADNNGCALCSPNENYAREILQLFTIGLNELNPDGTPQLDQSGNQIPTYTHTRHD